jgi:3-isopropylmalate/(R)-2-methylmalate dehydratase small subunit
MKRLGLAAVVAESFGRIYFRNSIAIALPSLVCPGVCEAFEEHDVMEIDLQGSRVRNLTKGTELVSKSYTADMLAIIEKGGLMNVLKERLSQG